MKTLLSFFLYQTDLEKECPDIMKLDLLHVVGVRKATARKQPAFLSYGHKSLQDFGASKFVTERLETSKNIEVKIKCFIQNSYTYTATVSVCSQNAKFILYVKNMIELKHDERCFLKYSIH